MGTRPRILDARSSGRPRNRTTGWSWRSPCVHGTDERLPSHPFSPSPFPPWPAQARERRGGTGIGSKTARPTDRAECPFFFHGVPFLAPQGSAQDEDRTVNSGAKLHEWRAVSPSPSEGPRESVRFLNRPIPPASVHEDVVLEPGVAERPARVTWQLINGGRTELCLTRPVARYLPVQPPRHRDSGSVV